MSFIWLVVLIVSIFLIYTALSLMRAAIRYAR